jgi:hypothetical protein
MYYLAQQNHTLERVKIYSASFEPRALPKQSIQAPEKPKSTPQQFDNILNQHNQLIRAKGHPHCISLKISP